MQRKIECLWRRIPSATRSFALFVCVFAAAQTLSAATQANFSVSAPPLPWFEFEKGQWDLRVAGNYTSVSGKESGTNKEVSVTGGGVSFVGRYAFNDYLAADFGYYFVGISAARLRRKHLTSRSI